MTAKRYADIGYRYDFEHSIYNADHPYFMYFTAVNMVWYNFARDCISIELYELAT